MNALRASGPWTFASVRSPACGLRRLLASLILAALPLLAAPAPPATDDIPPLRPPRTELPPGLWEQYGAWIVVGAVLLSAAAGAGLWLLVRPKPPVVVPPAALARQELEVLRQRSEDGVLLSRVSQVLRRYVSAAFGLPPGEMTTTDFNRAIGTRNDIGPEIVGALGDFLRRCDERKFAPLPPQPPLGAVEEAAKLIGRAEARRAALAAAQPPKTNGVAESAKMP